MTPDTGNLLAMDIAHATADTIRNDNDISLEQATTSRKREIKYTGLEDLKGQLAHGHIMHLLTKVRRGWTAMFRTGSKS